MILRAAARRASESRASWFPSNPGDIPPPWVAEDGVPDLNSLPVGEARALRASAVYACHQVYVDDISTTPLKHYLREGTKRTRLDLPDLFAEPVLGEIMDLPDWLARLLSSYVLRGNAYARVLDIDDVGATHVDPLHPDKCKPFRQNGRLRYRVYGPAGGTEVLDPFTKTGGEIWHVRHLAQAGHDEGLSMIGHAQAVVTLALAAETFGAELFLDGALPSGKLKTDEKIPDTQIGRKRARQIVRDFERVHKGRRRTALLTGGADWEPVTINPNEAQFIETRKFQLEDIARMMRVKPHKIGILDRATFNNIEQMGQEHVTDTLQPPAARFELAFRRLFPFADAREYFKFDFGAFLRGDTESRFKSHALGKQWGFRNTNKILELEDEDGIGPDGDVYLQPLNMRDAAAPSLAERAKAANELIFAGYDADTVSALCDLPGLTHTGVIPKATNLLPEEPDADPNATPAAGLPDTRPDAPGATP